MQDRSHLLTEQRLPESMSLDSMSIDDAVALIHQQDMRAVHAVGEQNQQIAQAVELVVAAFKKGGRLIYIGAGTSGRLGVLDASECPPTFRVDPTMVQGIIAGGDAAMFRSQEGAEDSPESGAEAIAGRNVGENDVVMGIAAGGTTPYVWGALRQARRRGAKTIFFCCVAPTASEEPVDVTIRPLVGPEVLTGSTRLKAGTATKLVLNAITTIAMVRLGKCYQNLMVDLRASNVKLRDRATRIIAAVTGLDKSQAAAALEKADGHVKLAIVMQQRHIDAAAAAALLDRCGGHLHTALLAEKGPC